MKIIIQREGTFFPTPFIRKLSGKQNFSFEPHNHKISSSDTILQVRLIYCEEKKYHISAHSFSCAISKGEFIFIKQGEKCKIEGENDDGTCLIFDLETDSVRFSSLMLEEKTIFNDDDGTILSILYDACESLTKSISEDDAQAISSRVLRDISEKLFCISIPTDQIGINGFSVKGVAVGKYGFFHGKYCLEVTPDPSFDESVVLENYDLSKLLIDINEYEYARLTYYYESPENTSSFARLRILSCVNENGDFFWYKKENLLSHESYAQITAGRWEQVIFPLHCDNESFKKHKKLYICQMKTDPFGARLSSCIEKGEKMYISSLSFLKKLPEKSGSSSDFTRLKTVLKLMNDNFRYDHELEFYADRVYLSVSRFREWFKNQTGVSPHKYILMKRIEQAKLLLVSSQIPVSEIAGIVGFSDPHYFSRLFMKYSGNTAQKFRSERKKQ